MVAANFNLYAAFLASFALGTICNVLLLRRFYSPSRHHVIKDLVLTFGSNGAATLVGLGIYASLLRVGGVGPVVAKITSNGVTFLINYVVRRRFF
jgi:putative flippase GtrA